MKFRSQTTRITVFLPLLIAAVLMAPSVETNAADRAKASDLIKRQTPAKISPRVFQATSTANSWVKVNIGKQRAYLMNGNDVAIDTPISTGKRNSTPHGSFTILEKDKDHRSSIYGSFVDAKGRVVRSGVSTKIDSAPSGTRYLGAPMWYFMRMTWTGVGMHVGHLPGYPASHGCIRMPKDIAPLFYKNVKLGTKVVVE